MKRRRLAALCFAASFLFPAAANAACSQEQLGGLWQAYAMSVTGGGDAYWSRCRLNINASSGAIVNTTCVSSLGNAALRQGQATLINGPNCTFTAQFKIDGVLNRVTHATLSPNGLDAQGVGVFPGGGIFIFNMTKLCPNLC